MDRIALRNFAIWARNKLIADIQYRAGLMGITVEEIKQPLPQSTRETQFFDIGTAEPYAITGDAIKQRDSLINVINQKAKETDYVTAYKYIVEGVAYTWFNRLIAVRFMEVNDYLPSHIRVLSSESGKMEPDLVTTPFDAELPFTDAEKQEVIRLKNDNELDECFRILFIKQCNALNEILPALFEKTSDYTEVLLNISAIDKEGVVYHLINDIPEEDFNIEQGGQVEIIGWMYQFYNTELNDQVYDGSMSKGRITKELLPAATTIYTPDWVIRYMVDNSLGRIWMEGHPNDSLKSTLKYYLDEAAQETYVKVKLDEIHREYAKLNPENIHFIDPCMGSGHILVYAFDVLMQIYTSTGYSERDAARSILENNLYGLDIDDRAYQMAYFAVMMKARQYNRRILSADTPCHVYSIQESNSINRNQLKYFGADLTEIEKNDAMNQIAGLIDTFKDAKEYGSILDVENYDWKLLNRFVQRNNVDGQISLDTIDIDSTCEKLKEILEIGEVMARKYEAVVTNPPYFNSSRFSDKLSIFAKEKYENSKADLSMMVYEKVLRTMLAKDGLTAFVTTTSWMYLKSFEELRKDLISHYSLRSLIDFGTELFEGKVGHNPIVSWVTANSFFKGKFTAVDLSPFCFSRRNEKEPQFFNKDNYKLSKQESFYEISGCPIAYNLNDKIFEAYKTGYTFEKIALVSEGVKTGNNDLFLRFWSEVNGRKFSFGHDNLGFKWVPHHKGGEYHKWYGNNEWVIDWQDDGEKLKKYPGAGFQGKAMYFASFISWSKITSKGTSFRYIPQFYLFDSGSPSLKMERMMFYLGFLNSKVTEYLLRSKNPTLNCQVGDVKSLPLIDQQEETVTDIVEQNIILSKRDWDSSEISWDFKKHPLI